MDYLSIWLFDWNKLTIESVEPNGSTYPSSSNDNPYVLKKQNQYPNIFNLIFWSETSYLTGIAK